MTKQQLFPEILGSADIVTGRSKYAPLAHSWLFLCGHRAVYRLDALPLGRLPAWGKPQAVEKSRFCE